MSPQETTAFLSYCAGLDQWLKATGPDEAAMMAAGWTDMLRNVPLDFARKFARSHYGHADSRTIQPGDVLSGWRSQHDREQRTRDRDERRTAGELEAHSAAEILAQGVIPMAGATEYITDLQAAIAAGRDPRTVTRPASVRVISLEMDTTSRRCVFHDVCVCTHTECRAGWLDAETTVVNGIGRKYPAVERCPRCDEALTMAQETGRARKPSAASRR